MTAHEHAVHDVELDRHRFGELADALLPGGLGLPCATEADTASSGLDRVLAVRPALACALAQALAWPGTPQEALRALRTENPDAYDVLVLAVAGGYFANPTVRRNLGYPGVAPRKFPAAPGEVEFYLEGDVLQPVLDRGPIYRPVPGQPPPKPSDVATEATEATSDDPPLPRP